MRRRCRRVIRPGRRLPPAVPLTLRAPPCVPPRVTPPHCAAAPPGQRGGVCGARHRQSHHGQAARWDCPAALQLLPPALILLPVAALLAAACPASRTIQLPGLATRRPTLHGCSTFPMAPICCPTAEAVDDFSAAIDGEPRFSDFHKRRGQARMGARAPRERCAGQGGACCAVTYKQLQKPPRCFPSVFQGSSLHRPWLMCLRARRAPRPACLQPWARTRARLTTCALRSSWRPMTPPRRGAAAGGRRGRRLSRAAPRRASGWVQKHAAPTALPCIAPRRQTHTRSWGGCTRSKRTTGAPRPSFG